MLTPVSHKEWLDNEYSEWVKALQESTVDNFKEHPMIRRMLSLDIEFGDGLLLDGFYAESVTDVLLNVDLIHRIGGMANYDSTNRMIYYAEKVLKNNPKAIVEIGGGCGQFYAVLRALGYKGEYFIYDLPEVKEFQRKYLDRVTELTGLNTDLTFTDFDYCVSFYCLGELDDDTKKVVCRERSKEMPSRTSSVEPT